MDVTLESQTVRGFKSIRDLDSFVPGRMTVLIGPNGSGKSNLLSFFRFVSWMLAAPGEMQRHVAMCGGASSLLFEGPSETTQIGARLDLVTDRGRNEYQFQLSHAAGDTLIFTDERFRFSDSSRNTEAPWKELGAGHREARILEEAESGNVTAKVILAMMRKLVIYQFHNTSATARVRQKWDEDDSRWLREDAANLGAVLRRLRDTGPPYYRRIVETTRQILPFFADYALDPEYGKVILTWREEGSDTLFGAHQAADGMLRVMALVALLLQPEGDLPAVLVLDEPELGLHPSAIATVAGMLRAASRHCQVVIATQSAPLVDHFDPADVVVTERNDRESTYRRLDEKALESWLQEYSVAELWEKNVIGGRP